MKLEEVYATPDSRDHDQYQKDTTKTEEIPRDNMSQQAHKSDNATSINNEGPDNTAQPLINSNLNSQILMVQLSADNS